MKSVVLLLSSTLFLPLFSQQYHFQELKLNGDPSTPLGINNPGTIVGYGPLGGFILRQGERLTYPINFDGYKGELTAINNLGDMAGVDVYCPGRFDGCFYYGDLFSGGHLVKSTDSPIDSLNSKGDFTSGNLIYLADGTSFYVVFQGTDGHTYSTDLNGIAWDRTIVGCVFDAGSYDARQAVLRGPKGNILQLRIPGAIASCATAINDAAGKIVGNYQETGGGPSHSFLYDYVADLIQTEASGSGLPVKTIQIQSLDYPGAESTFVTGINGKGTVIGTAKMHGGPNFGFIATPDTH